MVNRYPSLRFEKPLWKTGFIRIAGIDEAGRGAWAGPVCAAAVILPPDPSLIRTLDRVRDSKLMTPLARETWAPRIREFSLAWAVGFASPAEIDGLGILPATKLAAARSLATLSSSNSSFLDSLNPESQAAYPLPPDFPIPDYLLPHFPFPDCPIPDHLFPDYLLTDYLIFPNIALPQTALVKGDRLSLSVAAASVLAKTARDALMRLADARYPGYGFARHKGYGTSLHRQAIHQLGLCEIHRRSFSIPFSTQE